MKLVVSLFEVNIIETIILLEYFSNVWLPQLFKVSLEITVVKVIDKILNDFCHFQLLLSWYFASVIVEVEFKFAFQRLIVFFPVLSDVLWKIWRVQCLDLNLLELISDEIDSVVHLSQLLFLHGIISSIFYNCFLCNANFSKKYMLLYYYLLSTRYSRIDNYKLAKIIIFVNYIDIFD